MKKGILCFLMFFMMMSNVHAQSYCVMSGNGEEVVDEKDMHKTQSVASISKIMTAIVAIEHGNLEDTWNVSDTILQANGSSIYLQVGQSVTLKSLLYGLMLRSGNDAATEIAAHVSGNVDDFVVLMNEKAKELGMQDTTFHNPSGLDEEDGGNISSAYDMALLMQYAMKNATFQEITGSKYYTSEWNLRWKNKNRLLFDYAQTTGGKTGFTKKAGRTLVSSAAQDGMESIVVTLGMSDDFDFHETAHQQVFATHTPYTLVKQGTYYIENYQITIDEDIVLALPADQANQVHVKSYLDGKTYTIEAVINDKTQIYTFEGVKQAKGGWFS